MGEVRRYFRDYSWGMRVPRRLRELHVQISRTTGDLAQKLGRAPTAGELSRVLERSEEHTSELQSHLNLVCRLLLEKKKILSSRFESMMCCSGLKSPADAASSQVEFDITMHAYSEAPRAALQ